MSDGMDEIIEDFVTEAEESLEKIDPLFVELESKGYDKEILNDIFRSMHTIKGAAGFLGFQSVVDVAHRAESLLKRLREGEMVVTSSLISVILKSTDIIKLLLSHIKAKDGVEEDVSEILADLDVALEEGLAAAPGVEKISEEPQSPAPPPEVAAPAVRSPEAAAPTQPVTESAVEPAGVPDVEETLPRETAAKQSRQNLIDELFGAAPGSEAPEGSAPAVEPPEEIAPESIRIEGIEGGSAAADVLGGMDIPEEIGPQEAPAVDPAIQAAIDAARMALSGAGAASVPTPEAPVAEPAASPATSATDDVSVPGGEAQASAAASQKPAGVKQQGGAAKSGLQTLRVDVDRIDKVMNLTGEIVLVRNRLLNISTALDQKIQADEHVDGLQEAVSFLDLVTSDIQLAVMKMRMQPIKKVFGKFPRLVRDISQNLGKDVQLNISGEDTEVDRSVIERIGDPLVHTLRNAIDHGVESIEERRAKGKPPKGLVDVRAYQQGSQIVIEVSDDGRGMDFDKIKRKAVTQGLVSDEEAQKMTDKEAINLVFLPGFTTMDVATELSGRGVGMDVVKTNISRLNGYVEIISKRDAGTTLRISIPLTLAIIQALMVRNEGVQYAIPLGPIEETLKVGVNEINYVSGNPMLSIRNKVYPLAELSDMLNMKATGEAPEGHEHRYVLVIAVGDRHFCVGVDELIGQEEVVIKAIDGIDTDATGILGATITGEGKIVLILDPAGMSRIITGLATV